MAAITSAAASDWATGSTWVGGVAPGDGDTAILAHDVTIADGTTVTVGTSGATGTTAITINDGKKLIIGQGISGTLICRGDIVMTQTNVTRVSGFYAVEVKSGATLEFDASAAATPLSQTYVCRPSAGNQPNSRVKFSGTSGFHATVRSNASGGNGRFSLGGFNTRLGSVVGTYVDLTRIGDASNPAFQVWLSSTAVEPDTFSLSNYTMDGCGTMTSATNLGSGTVVQLIDGRHTNTAPAGCFAFTTSTNAITTGTREITRVVMDKLLGDAGSPPFLKDFTLTDCMFDGSWSITMNATTLPALIDKCFIRKSATGSSAYQASGTTAVGGTIRDCFLLTDNTGSNNFKWFQEIANTSFTITGFVWQSEGSDTTGDCIAIISNSHTGATTFTVKNNLCLPQASNGERPGTCVTQTSADAEVRVVAEHNTWPANTEAAFVWGETGKPVAGNWSSLKSNLVHGPVSPQGLQQYLIHDYAAGGATTDVAAPADADYNWTYGLKAGSALKGYNATFSTPPGVHDVSDQNPNFVDTTRNLATWSASRGGTATTAGARALIQADPTLGDVARQWIRDGWRPTNIVGKDAGHDGVTIGALEGVWPSTGPLHSSAANSMGISI